MTGSAATETAANFQAREHLGAPVFRAAQGRLMGRPSIADVEVTGVREPVEGVRPGGHGVVLNSAEAGLPLSRDKAAFESGGRATYSLTKGRTV